MSIRNSLATCSFCVILFITNALFALDSVTIKHEFYQAWKNAQSAWLLEIQTAESIKENKLAGILVEMASPWLQVLTDTNEDSSLERIFMQLVDMIFSDNNIIQKYDNKITYKISNNLCGIFAKLYGDATQSGPNDIELSCNDFMAKNSLLIELMREQDNNLSAILSFNNHKIFKTILGETIIGQDYYFAGINNFIEAARDEIPKFISSNSWLHIVPLTKIDNLTGALSWRFSHTSLSDTIRASFILNILEPIILEASAGFMQGKLVCESSPEEQPSFILSANKDSSYLISLNLGAIKAKGTIFLEHISWGRIHAELMLTNNNLRINNLSMIDKLVIYYHDHKFYLKINNNNYIEKILVETNSLSPALYFSPLSLSFESIKKVSEDTQITEILTVLFFADTSDKLIGLNYPAQESLMRHEAHGNIIETKIKRPENIISRDLFIPELSISNCENNSVFKLDMGSAKIKHKVTKTKVQEILSHDNNKLIIPEGWSLKRGS